MDSRNRDWGRPNPVDYVPVAGVFYRCYWCWIARRGFRSEKTEPWRKAVRSEYGRLFVALSVTAALVVFVALGGTTEEASALVPALVFALAGVFVHRLLSVAGVF
jgi:TRAP-type C4-dicarboxylate transport system permease large subunit